MKVTIKRYLESQKPEHCKEAPQRATMLSRRTGQRPSWRFRGEGSCYWGSGCCSSNSRLLWNGMSGGTGLQLQLSSWQGLALSPWVDFFLFVPTIRQEAEEKAVSFFCSSIFCFLVFYFRQGSWGSLSYHAVGWAWTVVHLQMQKKPWKLISVSPACGVRRHNLILKL